MKIVSYVEQAGSDDSRSDLESHRALFAARFLPDVQYWMEWVQDRISLRGATSKDLIELDDLFSCAISQCPSIEILNEWIENAFHRYEAELTVLILLILQCIKLIIARCTVLLISQFVFLLISQRIS